MSPGPLIAVDIGNSRIKFGLFADDRTVSKLPLPKREFEAAAAKFDPSSLDAWLAAANVHAHETMEWWIASVNRAPTDGLIAWLKGQGAEVFNTKARKSGARLGYCLLKYEDLPLGVALSEPGRVGIDRLLGAVAANRLRAANRAAVVIDVGSAITVDLVSPQGDFLGGAILPGIGMSARAMHDFTDLLPLLAMDELVDPPPALGTSTLAAMQSGLYWGAVGGIKELIARLHVAGALRDPDASLGETRARETLDIFLTGGAAPSVAQFVDLRATFVPHLVLGGIALTAQQ